MSTAAAICILQSAALAVSGAHRFYISLEDSGSARTIHRYRWPHAREEYHRSLELV
jgi:hypothetical protein